MHYLFKRETILPSQKNFCHPILAHFEKDQFSICTSDTGERIITKPLDSFFSENFKQFQSQYKKPIKKNTATILQQSATIAKNIFLIFINMFNFCNNGYQLSFMIVLIAKCTGTKE